MAASKGSALTVGDQVGATYEVVDRVGAGGMGVVYKARDLKLERFVALKFLPPGLNASKLDKERFLKEARIASSLDHPNTGVIYGIEETDDGHTFIVMAYYEGQSLAHRIQDGPLPAAEVVEIATQIARGLAEAHSHNIIHRDIKPSNVMFTPNGMVKIVDFGLAHVSEATATLTHGTVGTLTYISPEQATGRTADQRSDIWALGVTLTKHSPATILFSGRTWPRPSWPSSTNRLRRSTNLPVEVQQVVYRCLSKDPEKRYQSCEEMLLDWKLAKAALVEAGMGLPSSNQKLIRRSRPCANPGRRLRAPAWPLPAKPRLIEPGLSESPSLSWSCCLLRCCCLPCANVFRAPLFGPRLKHIAVLPFDNVGNNAQDQALTEGLVDSLSGRLSNLEVGKQTLWVIPSSEVRRLKVTDPAAALRQLGATLVVKGTVTREGQQVRVNMDLIDTKDLRQIGSVDLEDQAGDLATLQDEAVSKLAHLMNVSVTADMLQSTGGSVNPAAYENYLTALGYMQRYDKPGNLDLAIQALQESVKTDPRFALGYAQLGEAYRMKSRLEQNPEWLQRSAGELQEGG